MGGGRLDIHQRAVQSEGGGGTVLHVGGRSNRAKEEFKSELDDVLNQLPEYM